MHICVYGCTYWVYVHMYVCLLLEPTTLVLLASGFTTNYLKYGASVALGA